MSDTLAGDVDGIVMDLPPAVPLIQEGRLTALAVTSQKRFDLLRKRSDGARGVPGFTVTNWMACSLPPARRRPWSTRSMPSPKVVHART